MRPSAFILLLPALALALETADIIALIAPSSTSCAPSLPDCRTAPQIAPYIDCAISSYGLCSPPEQAAVLALMAFESAEFKYKHNVFPGRPGQGTANMQMPNYNLLYAKSLEPVAPHVAQYESVDGLSDDQLNHILGYLTPDMFNFASGAWFLTTQCDGSVRGALIDSPDDGFRAYMQCVGVEVSQDRLAYWQRAKQAFNIC
ncbi:hypothetical protein ESCO_006441 [Escovopsis weberi]|uniref:Uncharacterized protein n=1 Tax=Escovopsis weberi TaxID=150374 RepID=A0A0N0RSY2_ESCWE|nr:hypothetical protein ESCO_006441 [Escovopsis weberi]